jgi:hypothetical protein
MNNRSLPTWIESYEDEKGKPVTAIIDSIDKMPKNVIGFIYRIRFVDGTQYIGKKNIYSTRTVMARKNGKPRDNVIDNIWKNTGKGYRQKYEVLQIESNWKSYCGSSKECANRVPIEREILDYAYNKYQLTYKETEALFFYQVLEDETYLNDNILGKFFRGDRLFENDPSYEPKGIHSHPYAD